MRIRNYIASLLAGISLSTEAQPFVSKPIDTGATYYSTTVKVDQKGLENIVWTTSDNRLRGANSRDDFKHWWNYYGSPPAITIERSPDLAIDPTNALHTVSVIATQVNTNKPIWWTLWSYNRRNSTLGMNQAMPDSNPSIAIDRNNIKSIVSSCLAIKDPLDYNDYDIWFMSFLKYPAGTNLFYRYTLPKQGIQRNPLLKIDSTGRRHMVWEDLRNGGRCLYYTSSTPTNNFTFSGERRITDSYSNGADFEIDREGRILVLYRQSKLSNLTENVLCLSDITNTNDIKTTTLSAPFKANTDSKVDLSIDSLNRRHIAWSEIDGDTMRINYASSDKDYKPTVVDTSSRMDLGYVSIDCTGNSPIIAGNVHSTYLYKQMPNGTFMKIQ